MNERIVPCGHDEEWNHVDDGEDARSISQFGGDGSVRLVPLDSGEAEGDVGAEVCYEKEQLEPRGQDTHVDGI